MGDLAEILRGIMLNYAEGSSIVSSMLELSVVCNSRHLIYVFSARCWHNFFNFGFVVQL